MNAMADTYTVAQAQASLPRLVRVAERRGFVPVSRRGKTVAFIVSADRIDALIESMELLADPKAMDAVRRHRAGRLKFKDVTCLDEDQG
jgi:PHD/YefM family antitoxin component YafN of YafNO toxin-antitoxin module